MNIVCKIFGHKEGKVTVKRKGYNNYWTITCSRCGYKITYPSSCCRLVSKERDYKFNIK